MGHQFTDENPYQPPPLASFSIDPSSSQPSDQLVKKFRSQVHALGALWIIFGGLCVTGAGFMLAAPSSGEMAELKYMLAVCFGLVAAIWTALGVLTCLKHQLSIYLGLILTYLLFAIGILSFNLCMMAVCGVAIFQGHRVLKMASQLRKSGVSLTW
jgi:hypothetical protein